MPVTFFTTLRSCAFCVVLVDFLRCSFTFLLVCVRSRLRFRSFCGRFSFLISVRFSLPRSFTFIYGRFHCSSSRSSFLVAFLISLFTFTFLLLVALGTFVSFRSFRRSFLISLNFIHWSRSDFVHGSPAGLTFPSFDFHTFVGYVLRCVRCSCVTHLPHTHSFLTAYVRLDFSGSLLLPRVFLLPHSTPRLFSSPASFSSRFVLRSFWISWISRSLVLRFHGYHLPPLYYVLNSLLLVGRFGSRFLPHHVSLLLSLLRFYGCHTCVHVLLRCRFLLVSRWMFCLLGSAFLPLCDARHWCVAVRYYVRSLGRSPALCWVRSFSAMFCMGAVLRSSSAFTVLVCSSRSLPNSFTSFSLRSTLRLISRSGRSSLALYILTTVDFRFLCVLRHLRFLSISCARSLFSRFPVSLRYSFVRSGVHSW